MIGEPGEGWPLAMTVVSHEREPGELGYVARYRKVVKELDRAGAAPTRPGSRPSRCRDLGWAIVEVEMLRTAREPPAVRPARRHLARARGLGRQAADDLGRAGGRPRRAGRRRPGHGGDDDTWMKVYLYSRAQSVMGGTSQIQRNLSPAASSGCPPHEHLRPAPRARGRGRRADPHRPPQPARAAQRHEPRAAPAAWPTCSRRSTPTPTPGPWCSPATVGPSRPAATSPTSTS